MVEKERGQLALQKQQVPLALQLAFLDPAGSKRIKTVSMPGSFYSRKDPAGSGHKSYSPVLATTVLLARCKALKERCPPRQKLRVGRLKANLEPRLT